MGLRSFDLRNACKCFRCAGRKAASMGLRSFDLRNAPVASYAKAVVSGFNGAEVFRSQKYGKPKL